MERNLIRVLRKITQTWEPMTLDGVLVEVREAYAIVALFESASSPERKAYLHGLKAPALVAEVRRIHGLSARESGVVA